VIALNQPTRSKLINKNTQTLPAAAKWLANSLGEEVTEADILRLALEDRLTLSVKLETGTMAIRSRVVNYKKADLDANIAKGIFPGELKRNDLPDEIIESIKKSFVDIMKEDFEFWELLESHAFGLHEQRHIIVKSMLDMAIDNLRTNKEDQYLVEENYEPLKTEVFDLSMLGTEIVEVKRRNYKLTGGPNVDVLKKGCIAGTGVCLKGSDVLINMQNLPGNRGNQH
jgi:hypothetical protein